MTCCRFKSAGLLCAETQRKMWQKKYVKWNYMCKSSACHMLQSSLSPESPTCDLIVWKQWKSLQSRPKAKHRSTAYNVCLFHEQLHSQADRALNYESEPGRHSVRENRILSQYDHLLRSTTQSPGLKCRLSKSR